MAIETQDIDILEHQTGNIYNTVAVLSKRARQISLKVKGDLDNKLAYFEGFEPELEDPKFQEEQARISLDYETRPKATEQSIKEMMAGEIYFRDPTSGTEL